MIELKTAENIRSAVIVVDCVNSFYKDGELPVPGAEDAIEATNRMIKHAREWDDWELIFVREAHPEDHGSFAEVHGVEPFTMGELNGMPQMMWPKHGVKGTHGAEFHPDIDYRDGDKVFEKGMDKSVDSYSGFFDNGGQNPTGLSEYLNKKDIARVYVAGLAGDYCVFYTALDSLRLGFYTKIVFDATAFIDSTAFHKSIEDMPELVRDMVLSPAHSELIVAESFNEEKRLRICNMLLSKQLAYHTNGHYAKGQVESLRRQEKRFTTNYYHKVQTVDDYFESVTNVISTEAQRAKINSPAF